MENKRAIVWSIAAAVGAAIFYMLSVNKAVDNRIGNLDKKSVIIKAIRDIEPGTRIDESMIARDVWPSDFVPPKTATVEIEVVGQVAQSTIKENEPIMTTKLIPFDESSLDKRIPKGTRAVTIGIRDDQDVVGVAGLIRPGQFVDVLLTLYVSTREIERGASAPLLAAAMAASDSLKAEVRTIFQHIQILAVGQDQRLASAQVNRSTSAFSGGDLANKNVTVALTPADVQRLILAQSTGRITLTLRPFGDTGTVDNLDYLDPFKAFGIKMPIVVGPPPAYREIRGGQVYATPF